FSFRSFTCRPYTAVEFTDYYVTRTQVLVPIGLGPRASLLQAVTDEFSAGLWWATVGAVLAVAVATALAAVASLGRAPLVAAALAPLEALAPLLGQPPPGGRPAYRPLSAVWLLMSVVLAAAYQGLLLGELTAPPGEIDSLEQLEQSGLEVRVSDDLYTEVSALLSPELQSRVSLVAGPDLPAAVWSVADMRNSALVIQNDITSLIAMGPLLRADAKGRRQRLHVFEIGPPLPLAYVAFTAGSPLRGPVTLTMQRQRDHGLVHYLIRTLLLPKGGHNGGGADQPMDVDQPAEPLRLSQLRPAFALLATCHVVAALVFLLEIACHKYSSRKKT
ncbi:Ionotropic receptor 123, partial [Frankliniella occidentalis]